MCSWYGALRNLVSRHRSGLVRVGVRVRVRVRARVRVGVRVSAERPPVGAEHVPALQDHLVRVRVRVRDRV